MKTLYLWDMAKTIFHEQWDSKKTGYPSYDTWLEVQLKKPLDQITDREYEEMYKTPFTKGWYFGLAFNLGAKEALEWSQYNEVFTTGTVESMDWREEFFTSKKGFSVKKYFQKINSTFDYGETNTKTKAMLLDYLTKKYQEGYGTVVYTDDKLENLKEFKQAADEIKKQHPDFNYRLYNILNNDSGLQDKGDYFTIGTLPDLLKNEKSL